MHLLFIIGATVQLTVYHRNAFMKNCSTVEAFAYKVDWLWSSLCMCMEQYVYLAQSLYLYFYDLYMQSQLKGKDKVI